MDTREFPTDSARAPDAGRLSPVTNSTSMSVFGVFAALASPNRLAILDALIANDRSSPQRGLSISDVASLTELSRFSASRHLGILREAGVVVAEPVGMRLQHQVAWHALESIEDWLYARIDGPEWEERSDE